MSKQSNSPSPSGVVRWGLMSLAEEVFDKAEYLSLPYGEARWGLKPIRRSSNLSLPFGKVRMG